MKETKEKKYGKVYVWKQIKRVKREKNIYKERKKIE